MHNIHGFNPLGLNEVDYSHYPDRAFQLEWFRSYLQAYKEYKDQKDAVSDKEVEILYIQVNKFALVSFYPSFVGTLKFR